jgi:flagellar biosynthesis/type III secretory pathway protein FliH
MWEKARQEGRAEGQREGREALHAELLPILAWANDEFGCSFLTHGHC